MRGPPPLLSLPQVCRIRELLAQGLTYREVARRAQCSRGSVASIATGYWDRQRERDTAAARRSAERAAAAGARWGRCPGCGSRALLPAERPLCTACRTPRPAKLRPAPWAPAGYYEPEDNPGTQEPPGTPTPAEIRARCLEVQARWTPEERADRLVAIT